MIIIKYVKILLSAVFVFVVFSSVSCKGDIGNIVYDRGNISVGSYNFDSSVMPLEAEWEFYWRKLYSPSDFINESPALTGYINVPGAWNGYNAGGTVLSGDGYATYRLKIKDAPPGSYALKIPTMATAYRMFVNDREVSSNGVTAEDSRMVPMQKPGVAFFDSPGGDISILVQVSNFMSDKGGMWETVYFGKRDLVLKKRELSLSLEMVLFGAFIIMAFYHFGLYIFRKKSSFTLYFGLVCFIISIRVIITGEFFLVYLFPEINWTLQIKTEFLTVFAGFTFFIIFLKKLYIDEFSDVVIRFYIISGLLFSIVSLILPVKASARIIPFYHIILVAGFLIILSSLVRAVKNRREDALYIIAGCIVLILVVINDILDSNGIINSIYLFPYGLLLFIFSQSVILARIFSDSFVRIEELSMQLGVSYIQIEEYNKNLETRIEERTAELAEANEKLRELDRIRTDFFANVSHELRTPLTLILAPVEDALSGRNLSRESLEMINRNGHNLLSLINDLLEVSRITAGRYNINVKECDLRDFLNRCCGEIESAAELKGITLTCDTGVSPLKVWIDEAGFRHIISNLFSNSFKFTESGGRIDISSGTDENKAVIMFSDTGCGIPRDRIATVFDRFTQADTSSTRRYEGTGIGLSIVKDIVEFHGGKVTVESRYIKDYPESHGTVFKISIPSGKDHLEGKRNVIFDDTIESTALYMPYVRGIEFSENDKPLTPAYSSPEENDLPAILVVEDNSDLRNLISGMLEGGFTVYTAANGREAIEVFERVDEIDLVLSDIMMPEMDGHELLKWMRQNGKFSGIPFIFITARADHFMKLEGLELGAVDYVTKPFNSEELLLRIRNQMEQKKIRNALRRNYDRLLEKLRGSVREDGVKTRSRNENGFTVLKVNRHIEEVCDFIKEHYTEELTREDLAGAIGLNPDTFSRLFNQHTGKTLNEYIHGFRIIEAVRRLIETDETVTRISLDVGFDSIRTFNRVFKKFTSMSPVEYRENSALRN